MEEIAGRRALALRPLALPFEHGAWGFLFEPIVLALLVSWSPAGLWLAVGCVAVFLVRHPLRLALGDRVKGRRYPRTVICERFAGGYLLVALAGFSAALVLAGWRPFVPLLAAVPLGALQLALELRARGRAMAAELSGAVAAGSIATAMALAGGWAAGAAAVLWALLALRAVPSILYVRVALRGGGRWAMIAAHATAVLVAYAIAPLGAVAATGVLLVRAMMPTAGLRARDIGVREVVFGAVTVALIAAGYRM